MEANTSKLASLNHLDYRSKTHIIFWVVPKPLAFDGDGKRVSRQPRRFISQFDVTAVINTI